MTVTLWLATADAEPPGDKVAEAAIADVTESITDDGMGYEVLSKLAQGVFPKMACDHLVNP